jgi:hypothetical protein
LAAIPRLNGFAPWLLFASFAMLCSAVSAFFGERARFHFLGLRFEYAGNNWNAKQTLQPAGAECNTPQLEGRGQPITLLFGELLAVLMFTLISVPFLTLSGGLILLGVVTIQNGGDAILYLTAGIFLVTAFVWFAVRMLWTIPRRRVFWFRLHKALLTYATATGCQTRSVTEISNITENRSRRRGGIASWLLEFNCGGWVVLPVSVTNSAELVKRLREFSTGDATPFSLESIPRQSLRFGEDRGLSMDQ